MESKSSLLELIQVGVILTRTNLGEAVFLKEGAKFADMYSSIRPSQWSPKQLRLMADYMEANPNCALMSDGSGKPVNLD